MCRDGGGALFSPSLSSCFPICLSCLGLSWRLSSLVSLFYSVVLSRFHSVALSRLRLVSLFHSVVLSRRFSDSVRYIVILQERTKTWTIHASYFFPHPLDLPPLLSLPPSDPTRRSLCQMFYLSNETSSSVNFQCCFILIDLIMHFPCY